MRRLTVMALLLGLLTGPPSPAQEASPSAGQESADDRPSGAGWSARTRRSRAEPAAAPGETAMFLRIYEGDRAFGPVLDEDGQLLGLNVTAALETCADGNTIVTALNIGGWAYRLDASCGDFSRGSRIEVRQDSGALVVRESASEPRPAGRPRVLRCEPRSWTCRTEVARGD